MGNLHFDFNWKLTLSVAFLLPVLVMLSLWQLDRAGEKKALAQQWQAQQSALPATFSAGQDTSRRFQRVTMQGEFLPEKYWLKENQFYNGQLGYEVIMPFATNSGVLVAVNRGWVAGSPLRDFVPQIETPRGSLQLSGTLVQPSDSKLIRESETSAKQWPHKILEVDVPVLRRQSQLNLYSQVLRLDADHPSAFEVNWRPINTSPAKHYGYAFQWALMAVVLMIMYVFASTNILALIKQKRRDDE